MKWLECKCINLRAVFKIYFKSAAFKPSVASPPLNQTRYNLNANQFEQQALLGLTDFLPHSLGSRGTEVMRLCWHTGDQWTFNALSCEWKKGSLRVIPAIQNTYKYFSMLINELVVYFSSTVACPDLRRGRGEIALQGHNRGPGGEGWWVWSPSSRGGRYGKNIISQFHLFIYFYITIHYFIMILCHVFYFASCLSITAKLISLL